jgi:ABC-2 type transport system permease protein
MKIVSVIRKSLKEQIRSFWMLILTVSMAPFFVFIYYLINESSQPRYDIMIINNDEGLLVQTENINYGSQLIETLEISATDSLSIPLDILVIDDRTEGIHKLKNKNADALVIIPKEFSYVVQSVMDSKQSEKIEVEFVGDLTSIGYMISAIWVGEIIDQSVFYLSGIERPFGIKETSLGISGDIDEFDIYIPGILIISIIMLMFTASIAIITEVENKTILGGISIVQVLVGILSVFITLVIAIGMGFNYTGSVSILFIVSILTCLSIISFSLIVAGFTKTVNEILVVGNFPLFLFMFFTGAAFPLSGKEIFSFTGYPFTIQGLMSPTHAISALRKTLVMDMGIRDIVPEISLIVILTLLYFFIGVWLFRRRHMRVR